MKLVASYKLQPSEAGRQSGREFYCFILVASSRCFSTTGQMGLREVGREREGS